nr:atherin-like [Meriones unguiculatus]
MLDTGPRGRRGLRVPNSQPPVLSAAHSLAVVAGCGCCTSRVHNPSRRRGRRQCQEGTRGGGGRPSHHPAPGEGRPPRLPPGGPAATSSPPGAPGSGKAADGAEPARCLPPRSSSIPVPGRASHPDPPLDTADRGSPPSGRPRAPRRPPSPHLTSPPPPPPEQQLCQTPESHPPPRALRSGPSRSLRRRRSPGRAEGTGRRERAGEGRGPHGRKRRGRGRPEEEEAAAGGSARARPLGAACALPRAEAPSRPEAAARTRVHSRAWPGGPRSA